MYCHAKDNLQIYGKHGGNTCFEFFTGAVALTFTALGVWLSIKLLKPKIEKVVIEKEVIVLRESFTLNEKVLNDLHISTKGI